MSMSGKSEKVLSPPHADKANEALEAGQVTEDVYIDPEVERRTIAKFDLYMMPQMMILQIVSYLDRTNIGISFRLAIIDPTTSVCYANILQQVMPKSSALLKI
jgi:hypothetical protein